MSTKPKKPGRKPTLIAYAVREYTSSEGEVKSAWNRIGAAWMHDDRKGFRLQLDSIPLSGDIVLRQNKPKDAAPEEGTDGEEILF